jgi:hypothetical protein
MSRKRRYCATDEDDNRGVDSAASPPLNGNALEDRLIRSSVSYRATRCRAALQGARQSGEVRSAPTEVHATA